MNARLHIKLELIGIEPIPKHCKYFTLTIYAITPALANT